MSSNVDLLRVEMRRALHRRAVWGLIGLFLAFAAIVGTISYVEAMNTPLAELRSRYPHAAVLTDWWIPGSDRGVTMTAAAVMMIGALLGGSTVAGAEWRAGTITTVLTWEPRRLRLHAARTASAFLLAVPIAFTLLIVFLAALLPTVLVHGTTAGADATWWWQLVSAVARISLFAGLAAVVGIALATIGRNTTFALVVVAGWMIAGENVLRALRPSVQDHLVGENLTTVVTWSTTASDVGHSVGTAGAHLVLYLAVAVTAATIAFTRRDIATR